MTRFERTPPAWMLLGILLLAPCAGAQEPPGARTPDEVQEQSSADEPGDGEAVPEDLSTTGDAWVDAQLADIGRYAQRYPDSFVDELARYHDAPRSVVTSLLDDGWEPGDLYFACALGGVTGRSCRFVIGQRGQPPQASWSALAAQLGAGVDTAAFARLKRGIVESYVRWARPLELDAELSRAFPGLGDGEG